MVGARKGIKVSGIAKGGTGAIAKIPHIAGIVVRLVGEVHHQRRAGCLRIADGKSRTRVEDGYIPAGAEAIDTTIAVGGRKLYGKRSFERIVMRGIERRRALAVAKIPAIAGGRIG